MLACLALVAGCSLVPAYISVTQHGPTTRQVTVSFPPLPEGTRFVQLVFHRSCGTVSVVPESAVPQDFAGASALARPRVNPQLSELPGDTGLLTLEWERSIGAGIATKIRLQFTGEALGVREWYPGIRIPEESWVERALVEEEDYWTWRTNRARQPHPHALQKRLFNKFDYNKPVLAQPADVLAALQARLEARQGDPSPTTPMTPGLKTQIEFEASFLKDLFRASFGAGLSDEELRVQIENTMDMFSCGMLSLIDDRDDGDEEHWRACQPNSVYIYYFAELADLCVDTDIDVAFWEPLRRPFVHMLSRFLECYETVDRDGIVKLGADGKLCGRLFVQLTHPLSPSPTPEELVAARTSFVSANQDMAKFRETWQGLAKRIDFECDDTIRLADETWR